MNQNPSLIDNLRRIGRLADDLDLKIDCKRNSALDYAVVSRDVETVKALLLFEGKRNEDRIHMLESAIKYAEKSSDIYRLVNQKIHSLLPLDEQLAYAFTENDMPALKRILIKMDEIKQYQMSNNAVQILSDFMGNQDITKQVKAMQVNSDPDLHFVRNLLRECIKGRQDNESATFNTAKFWNRISADRLSTQFMISGDSKIEATRKADEIIRLEIQVRQYKKRMAELEADQLEHERVIEECEADMKAVDALREQFLKPAPPDSGPKFLVSYYP